MQRLSRMADAPLKVSESYVYRAFLVLPLSVDGEPLVLETKPGKSQATQNGLSEVAESRNEDDIRLAASSIPLPEIHVPKPPI
jgi:hypothetical protein